MPKERENIDEFIERIVRKFPGVFKNDQSNLYCMMCHCVVRGRKLYSVTQHMATMKHREAVINLATGYQGSGETSRFSMGLSNAHIEREKSVQVPTHKWTTNQTLDLINEIEQRDCLWNPQSSEYKDWQAHEAAYKEVARILRIPRREICIKWNKLRASFNVGNINCIKSDIFQALKFLERTLDAESNNMSDTIMNAAQSASTDEDSFDFTIKRERTDSEENENFVSIETKSKWNDSDDSTDEIRESKKQRNSWCNQSEAALIMLWAPIVNELRDVRNHHMLLDIVQGMHERGFQFNAEEIRCKIYNLYKTYKQENSKILYSDAKTTEWPLYEVMHKMLGHLKNHNYQVQAEEATNNVTTLKTTDDPLLLYFEETKPTVQEHFMSSNADAVQANVLPGPVIKTNITKQGPTNITTARLQFEREKLHKEIEIEEKKLKLSAEKMQQELQIANQQFNLEAEKFRFEQEMRRKEYELKLLNLEKDERIAKFEIELKYKHFKQSHAVIQEKQ